MTMNTMNNEEAPQRQRVAKPGKISGWSAEEDEKLRTLTKRLGNADQTMDWCTIASVLTTRTPRQCRERYKNHAKPGIQTGI